MATASGSKTSKASKKHPNLACSSLVMWQGKDKSTSHLDKGTTLDESCEVDSAGEAWGPVGQSKKLVGQELPGALKDVATMRIDLPGLTAVQVCWGTAGMICVAGAATGAAGRAVAG